MNFYQRMGILPLKKNVNRDKCSFATKHLTFWAFIYRSDPSLSMKPICRFAHFVPPWAQSVFSFRFSGPRRNGISSLSKQSQLHCAGRPCNVMRYLKATFLIYALSMTWCWRRWPTWTLNTRSRRRSPMRSPTRKSVVGISWNRWGSLSGGWYGRRWHQGQHQRSYQEGAHNVSI